MAAFVLAMIVNDYKQGQVSQFYKHCLLGNCYIHKLYNICCYMYHNHPELKC